MRIAFIGAGSIGFTMELARDVPDRIRELASAMLAAQRQWLPQYG